MSKSTIIPLIFIFIVFVFGCNKENENSSYNNKPQNGLNNNVIHDTILLGYTFGMTKTEFEQKSNKLNKQGILRYNKSVPWANISESWSYDIKYSIDTSDKGLNIELNFSPLYFKNKLYKLKAVAFWKNKNGIIDENYASLFETLHFMYEEKYGFNDLKKVDTTKFGISKTYTFVKGNREIDVTKIHKGVVITYIDLFVNKEIDKIKAKELQKTINDASSRL